MKNEELAIGDLVLQAQYVGKYDGKGHVWKPVKVKSIPFDEEKFMTFINEDFPKELIRAKGYMWFSDNDKEVILFEQAGHNATVTGYAVWIAAMQDGEGKKELMENINLMT